MHGERAFGKRYEVTVRTGSGPDDFAPVAGFDTFAEAAAAAPAIVEQHWDYTTFYAYVAAIVDNDRPEMPAHRVASVEGQYFTVTNVNNG